MGPDDDVERALQINSHRISRYETNKRCLPTFVCFWGGPGGFVIVYRGCGGFAYMKSIANKVVWLMLPLLSR